MNADDYDASFDAYQELQDALKKQVNEAVAGLTPGQEDYVRTRLGEEFRFWRDK